MTEAEKLKVSERLKQIRKEMDELFQDRVTELVAELLIDRFKEKRNDL